MSKFNDDKDDLEQWTQMWDEISSDEKEQKFILQVSKDADVYEVAQELIHEMRDITPNENPIDPDSIGPDSENTPAVWLDAEAIKEIEDIKNRIFELENKFGSKIAGGNKVQEEPKESDNTLADIKLLTQKLEKLSSKFGLQGKN